ncbi:unnamed protein product [Brachionus calyciflorus]|uniref:Uncharacterized protein n=1 Tax=Brachionus calyciflorus TaxID=104777 RepID=A0A814QZT7_9BILA|nr:unnamed protein product [Brachionus calyciflorus]
MGACSTLSGNYSSSRTTPGFGGGFLYPYIKNVLFTLHLIYEETKLYRSLNHYYPSSLNRFLVSLLKDKQVKQAFPVIQGVTERIVNSIKIFVIISLCTQRDTNTNEECHPYPDYTLKFKFMPGEKFLYENIFSKCLEIGLCTLNEIYVYPLFVLFPLLEWIK